MHRGKPIRKATGFMSNSPELLKALNRKCVGTDGGCSRRAGGQHLHLTGDHARRAAQYPAELCHAIIEGIHGQLRADGNLVAGCIGMIACEDPIMPVETSKHDARFTGKFRDDITGQILRDDLVLEARGDPLL